MNSDESDDMVSANWDEIERDIERIQETLKETETREIAERIASEVRKRKEVEEAIQKENNELKELLKEQKFRLDEMEMERDVLLQQIHTYLEINSSLKIRLEEQRCQTGALKSQLNGDLESRIRMLERDRDKLIDSNVEKEKEVDKMRSMLEEANRGKEENDVTALKRELKRALEDKMKAEGRLREVLVEQRKAGERCLTRRRKGSMLRRSVSVGNVCRERFESMERSIILEGPRECFTDAFKLCNKVSKTKEGSAANHSDCSSDAEVKKQDSPEPSVHAQLDALRRGVFNLTRKLEYLKTQLINSGTIKEGARNLKRKAETEEILIESKPDFKNLRTILEDAKTLNAKLENLRDEKQKTIRREKEVQVEIKTNDVSSQTTETRRHFEKMISGLKQAVGKCETELEKNSTLKEEAFATFSSDLISFILSNLSIVSPDCFSLTNGKDCLIGGGLNKSKENGGGDNVLKIYKNPHDELKIQISRLKLKIETFEKLYTYNIV